MGNEERKEEVEDKASAAADVPIDPELQGLAGSRLAHKAANTKVKQKATTLVDRLYDLAEKGNAACAKMLFDWSDAYERGLAYEGPGVSLGELLVKALEEEGSEDEPAVSRE